MILRVYAMWGRSRIVLFVLLFVYMLQSIDSVVLPAIYNSSPVYFIRMSYHSDVPRLLSIRSTATTFSVLNFTVCIVSFTPSVPELLGVYDTLPRVFLSAMLLIFAIFRSLKQLIDMYNATKQWQPNRYMNQLTRDGTSYFIMYVSVSFSNICSI